MIRLACLGAGTRRIHPPSLRRRRPDASRNSWVKGRTTRLPEAAGIAASLRGVSHLACLKLVGSAASATHSSRRGGTCAAQTWQQRRPYGRKTLQERLPRCPRLRMLKGMACWRC